jgi:hypothetical protein
MLGIAPESPASGSIMKADMADRCRVGRSKTVVQQDRHVRTSGEPEQLNDPRDRILAWAQLHYTKRRQE